MVPALMRFQTSSSILVSVTGDVKMSPQNTNSVVKEASRSEEHSSMEMFKVEKFGFHLRVFRNVRKLQNLLPGFCYY